MSTQMNFQGGVNKKHTPSTATCGAAEKGEAKSPLHGFNGKPGKGRTPTSGQQKNFPN